MKPAELPSRHRDPRVQQVLRQAERVRYWWQYRGRRKQLLRFADPDGSVSLSAHEVRNVGQFRASYGIDRVNTEWYRLFKRSTGAPERIERAG